MPRLAQAREFLSGQEAFTRLAGARPKKNSTEPCPPAAGATDQDPVCVRAAPACRFCPVEEGLGCEFVSAFQGGEIGLVGLEDARDRLGFMVLGRARKR